MPGCKSRLWKPVLNPKAAKGWEIDIFNKLGSNKRLFLNGFICCIVTKSEIYTVLTHGFTYQCLKTSSYSRTVRKLTPQDMDPDGCGDPLKTDCVKAYKVRFLAYPHL